MSTNEFRITIIPRWADIDANLHVRNTAFSEWATNTRVEWLASKGFNIKELRELNFSVVIFEDSTKYFKEIFLGEHIESELELVGLKKDGSRFHVRHIFLRNGVVCVVHDVKGGWLNVANRRIDAPPTGLVEMTASLLRSSDYADIVSPT
jgi:acyl-CoA thioester hydrolase